MCGPSGVMESCSPARPKLMLPIVFLLVSTNTVRLHGNPPAVVEHNLHCVNDYLFTINCSLSIAASENSNSSYWLAFVETYEKEKYVCMLTNTNGHYFCSVKASNPMPDDDQPEPFTDIDTFQVLLCHNKNDGSEICEQLVDEYAPVANIQPNAPCCLTVSHNSSQHHFTWKSTYEEYSLFTALVDNLKYQLYLSKRGEAPDVMSHEINTDSMNFSVDDHAFVPDSEYSARVRSSPNQASYKGQWSDWSSEVHWRTGSAVNDLPSNTLVSGLGKKVFIPLCVMVPLVLLLCYAPVKKWRQGAFIPTPAPLFHTLYSDCQGDFKSWVVTQENTADMLKAEETLQIDTLTKCADVQEEECQSWFHQQLTEGSTYSNITHPGCDPSLLGIPYAVSTMAPPSAPRSSLKSLTSQPGSPAEGDAGCWFSSHTSLERGPPWYCNEYCTLSAFQQESPPTKSYPTGTIRVDAITEDITSGLNVQPHTPTQGTVMLQNTPSASR